MAFAIAVPSMSVAVMVTVLPVVVVIVVDADDGDNDAVATVVGERSKRKLTVAKGKLANQTTRKETRILDVRYKYLDGATFQGQLCI